MKRLLSSIFLVAAVLLTSCATVPRESRGIQIAESQAVIISANTLSVAVGEDDHKIVGQDSIPDNNICSGVIVSTQGTEEIVVTAKHCTEIEHKDEPFPGIEEDITNNLIHIHFFDGDIGQIQKIIISATEDLAVITVHSRHSHNIHASFSYNIYRGEELFAFGMPDGFPWAYSKAYSMQGQMTAGADGAPDDFKDMVLIDCDSCTFGDSGGGVYDSNGNIIGLVNGSGQGPGQTFITPSTYIVALLGK